MSSSTAGTTVAPHGGPYPSRSGARRVAELVIVALVLASLTLGGASPAHADDPVPFPADAEVQFVSLVNAARAREGLGPVVVDPALARTAREWSVQMSITGALDHDPDLEADFTFVQPGWVWGGENVGAITSNSSAIVQTMFNAWMSSTAGHRDNILRADANRVGTGVVIKKVTGGYRLYVTQRFLNGPALTPPATEPGASAPAFDRYRPLTPSRILDTRRGLGGSALGPGATRELVVTGGSVPVTGVSAVALNLTATGPTTATHLTTYPTGAKRPSVSTLNVRAGETRANMVIAKVGTDGKISIFNNSGTTEVIGDITGYFEVGTVPAPEGFTAVTPVRVADTRRGTGGVGTAPVGPASGFTLDLTGVAGSPVPARATAVVLNVTAVAPTAPTHITVWPADKARPTASNVNVAKGETVPNLVIATVDAEGRASVFNNAGSTHVLVDVFGWFGPDALQGTSAGYTPLAPWRVLDTRTGVGSYGGPVAAGQSIDLAVLGRGGVPAIGVSAVVLNVTAAEPTALSHATVWPSSAATPASSNLNYLAKQTVANLVIVDVGTAGKVSLRNQAGDTHLIADVVGWFDAGVPAAG